LRQGGFYEEELTRAPITALLNLGSGNRKFLLRREKEDHTAEICKAVRRVA